MNKKKVDYRDYAGAIVKALHTGILVTTKAGDKINSMTIGWGTLGVIWEKPVFIAYVRDCRFTYEMLQKNPEFTVNIPVGDPDKKAIALLGSKSGRDMDKIATAGLTPVEPEVISVPGIKEFPLTLECKVIYDQKQEDQKLPEELRNRFYSIQPNEHFCFYGEIVASYLIEPENPISIVYEEELDRSAAYDGDKQIGECEYITTGNTWSITHTGVREEYGGKGIAKKLVLKVIEAARSKGVKISPVCSYAQKMMNGKEEFKDVLAE